MYQILPSVITSSSLRCLAEFIPDVLEIDATACFDLFVFRDADLSALVGTNPLSTSELLGNNATDLDRIVRWIKSEFSSHITQNIRIPALATYFPDITSINNKRRNRAINALTNTFKLAIELSLTEQPLMETAIIECVCGTVLDRAECSECRSNIAVKPGDIRRGDLVFKSTRVKKIQLLCDSLSRAIYPVFLKYPRHTIEHKFAIALELEPGPSYVLNSLRAMELTRKFIARDDNLRRFVGFNMDIAHMRIARIAARKLRTFRDLFIHAHIADHPGMHTRDQVVGHWTPIEQHATGYYPYLEILGERLVDAQKGREGLPFSGCIALELEGCNRIDWVHHGIARLKETIEVLNRKIRMGVPV